MFARLPLRHRFIALFVAALALSALSVPARRAAAGPGDVPADSVYLVGEFVDPVCTFQHGMSGEAQKACALVRGRVEQGMFFHDIRQRRLYAVVGQNHWEDPREGFLSALGDTFAIRAHVWKRYGSAAITVNAMYPWREQPEPAVAFWPWHWEWSVLLGCALLAVFYLLAITRWRRKLGGAAEPFERWRVVSYLSGLVVVVISLNGPLHDLSDRYLFSTHMVQHLLLAQIFPPLFLLGLPGWLVRRLLAPRLVRIAWAKLAAVPTGFLLYTVFFSLWHVPGLYELMMRVHNIHIVMHLMVMATAVLMWWPIIGAEGIPRPLPDGARLIYLFLLGIPMMAVAALLTLADHPLYEWYVLAPRPWGMTALEDQKLGGLIMWVPGGMFWWGVMTIVWFRWAARDARTTDDPLIAPS